MTDLLDELRRHPNLRWFLGGPGSQQQKAMQELATLITNHERAAAKRMRERCRLAALEIHAGLIASAGFDHPPVHVTQTVIDAIDTLEPEEPSK